DHQPADARALLNVLQPHAVDSGEVRVNTGLDPQCVHRLLELAMMPQAGANKDGSSSLHEVPATERDRFHALANRLRREAGRQRLRARIGRLSRENSLDELDAEAEGILRATYKQSSAGGRLSVPTDEAGGTVDDTDDGAKNDNAKEASVATEAPS
nr:hypothetical protein [Pseudomonadota bacterium]